MQRFRSLSSQFYKSRRQELASELPDNSILVIEANSRFRSNADAFYPYRHNSEFYYLTGITIPDVVYVLHKDKKGNSTDYLFFPVVPEWKKVWEGEPLTKEEAIEVSGIENIEDVRQLYHCLRDISTKSTKFYHIWRSNYKIRLDSEKRTAERLRRHFPANKKVSAHEIVDRLRTVKQPEEIEAIEKAIKITQRGLRELKSLIEPGVHEFKLESYLLSSFINNKSRGFAFSPIIASGLNSCILHYEENSSILRKGQVLLIDVGAEYKGYNADLTRVFPVGEFTKKGKSVYDAVSSVLRESVKFYKPGTTIAEINKNVGLLIQEELLQLGLLNSQDILDQDSKNPAYRQYFMHGAAHFLGLDVHDVGSRKDKLEPGMVLTLEPGIYVPEWETGVRLEEDVLITKDGCRLLS